MKIVKLISVCYSLLPHPVRRDTKRARTPLQQLLTPGCKQSGKHAKHTHTHTHLRAISTVMAKFSIFSPSMPRTQSSAMALFWKSQNAKPAARDGSKKRIRANDDGQMESRFANKQPTPQKANTEGKRKATHEEHKN